MQYAQSWLSTGMEAPANITYQYTHTDTGTLCLALTFQKSNA